MKKCFIFLVFVVMAFAISCGGGKSAPQAAQVKVAKPEIVIIEHKGTVLGANMPQWVEKAIESTAAVERMSDYTGKYAFIADQRGQDLSGLQTWANNFSVQPMVAQRIDNTVEAAFKGAQVGDSKKVGEYFQRYVETRTSINFAGLIKEGDWWVRTREKGGEFYRYIVLYTVDKRILDDQIQKYLDQKYGGSSVNRDPEEKELILEAKDLIMKNGLN